MQTLVLKSWKANAEPVDADGNFVSIVGRTSGLVAWFLSLIKIDPTTSLKISPERIEFSRTSLAGSDVRQIPLSSVCSTYYGYFKPWKSALAILVFFLAIGGTWAADTHGVQATMNFIFCLIAGLGLGLGYYFFNRSLTLGFVEFSGVGNGIRFKRSLIENLDINEAQAAYICQLTQAMIEERTKAKTG